MIAGINRAQPAAMAEELVDAVIAHRRDEIVGIGLEDYELAGPPERFAVAYDKARRAGLRRTAHSSEHAPSAANTDLATERMISRSLAWSVVNVTST